MVVERRPEVADGSKKDKRGGRGTRRDSSTRQPDKAGGIPSAALPRSDVVFIDIPLPLPPIGIPRPAEPVYKPEEKPKEQEHPKKRRTHIISGTQGKVIGVATTGLLIAAGFGAWMQFKGGVLPIPTGSPTPSGETTPEPTGTVTPTIEVTPSAVPTPTETPVPTEQTELEDAPNIPGLHKVLESGIVVYRADATNSFGLKENTYGGQVIKNLTIEGTKTHAEAFTIPVLNKLFPAAIAKESDKWLALLPIDPTKTSGTINLTHEKSQFTGEQMLKIEFSGATPALSIWPGKVNLDCQPVVYGIDCNDARYLQHPRPTDPMVLMTVMYGELDISKNQIANGISDVTFGQEFATATGPILISGQASKKLDTEFSKLFTEGSSDIPYYVFPTLATAPVSATS
jgi:hypothetical protein